MNQSIVVLNEVSMSYSSSMYAVKDLILSVKKGEILSLLGSSGCGKTTTLRLIAGLERQEKGSISIGGRIVANHETWVPPEKRGVAIVFQDYALFPHLTVVQNVAFGLRKLDKTEKKRRTSQVLEMVGLIGLEKRYPHELSGGQQQRVALARALAIHPILLLLDEPFSDLDADMRIKVREEVYRILKTIGITAILVTHDQDEAFSIADRVAVLNQGRIEQVGTPEEIYHKPKTRFVANFVGETAFVLGKIVSGGIDTELGLFSGANLRTCGGVGDNVEVMIRSDDIEMAPDEKGNCTVVQRRFRGSENIYTLRLSSGQMVLAARPSTYTLPVDIRVRAWANPKHVVIFRPDEASQCQIFEGEKRVADN